MTLRAHLRTARLVLRPLIQQDAPVLAGALNDFAISQWLAVVPFPYTLADAEWFIREGQFAVGHVWAICDGSGPVGVISIGKEFGYWLAKTVWGQGYATEAGRAVVADWFRDPEAGDLLSSHFAGNEPSRNVLTKLGFVEMHRGTSHSLARGADVESAKMRLTREAFFAATPLVIKTDRLMLRPVAREDEEAVVAVMNDLDVSGWLSVVPYPYSSADFQYFQSQYAVPGETFAVDDAQGFVGIIGVEDRTLGYWFVPAKHGRGYATEAARGVLAAHFAKNPADIASGYFEGNARSANVLRKLGFVETGRGMKYCRALGKDRHHVDMVLTRGAFAVANPFIIKTARLVLRPLQATDAQPIATGLNDWNVTTWLLPVPWPHTIENAQWFLNNSVSEGARAIELDGKFVGVVHLGSDGELGYWLDSRYHGKGYMTEAVGALLSAHFRGGGGKITGGYILGNTASRNVQLKVGFRETHVQMKHSVPRGIDVEVMHMILTAEAFFAANPLVIETDRLVLRAMRETDAPDLRRIVTIPDVGRMLLMFPPDWTEEAARAFTNTWRWKGDAMFRLAITRRGEDRLIGTIGVRQAPGETEAAIFYFLDPEAAGNGYASEVLAALLRELSRRFGPLPLVAGVFTDNPASARVLEKSGFVRTGTEMGTSAARLEPAPIWLYRLDPQLPEADR